MTRMFEGQTDSSFAQASQKSVWAFVFVLQLKWWPNQQCFLKYQWQRAPEQTTRLSDTVQGAHPQWFTFSANAGSSMVGGGFHAQKLEFLPTDLQLAFKCIFHCNYNLTVNLNKCFRYLTLTIQ